MTEQLPELQQYYNCVLLKKSNILQKWNKRTLLLDTQQKIFQILSSKGLQKNLNLDDYKITWEGLQEKKYYVFKLTALYPKNKKLIYKQVQIGDINESEIKKWYEYIQLINNGKFILSQKNEFQFQQEVEKIQEVEQIILSKHQSGEYLMEFNINGVPQNWLNTKIEENLLKYQKNYEEKQKKSRESNDEETKEINKLDISCTFNSNMYEKEINENIELPIFTYAPSKILHDFKLHNLKESIILQQFQELKSPEFFREEISDLIKWYEDKKGSNIYQQTHKNFKIILEHNNMNIYQKNINNSHRCILTFEVPPQSLYEEIKLPSSGQLHPMLERLEIQPSDDNDECVIIQIIFKFYDENKEIKKKNIVYHQYSFQYKSAYFILCKTLKYKDAIIDSEIIMVYKIFKDQNNPQYTTLVTDVILNFKGEQQDTIYANILLYLQLMMDQGQQSLQSNNYYDNSKFSLKIREQEDLAENNQIQGSVELDTSLIDIQYNYQNTQHIQQKLSFIYEDADQELSKQNLFSLLNYIDVRQYIYNSLNCVYKMDYIYPQQEKRLISTPEQGHFCWKKDYIRDEEKGGLTYVNKEMIDKQRKVIFHLVKSVGSCLLQGKSLMNISMPVHIFEGRSFLQRIARSFGHAPTFLEKGGNTYDLVEQLKQTVCFYLSSFTMSFMQEKPFNPILGETLQARINGCPIYFEQISHHPPIMYYLMQGNTFNLYGPHEAEVSMGVNSLIGYFKGGPTVHFKNTKLNFKILNPQFMLYGTAIGNRYLNCQGRAYVYEPKSRLVCEVIYNPSDKGTIGNIFSRNSDKIDEIAGAIYQVTQDFINDLEDCHKSMGQPTIHKKLQIDPKKHIQKYISKLQGVWHNHVIFDSKEYWNAKVDFPFMCEYDQNLLPSDSMYRTDIIWLNIQDQKKSQEEKERLEVLQRHDAKLRKERNKKK